MRISNSLFLTFFFALSLAGCESYWKPSYIPAGSTYHQQEFHAPPGLKAKDIGYDYSASANEEALQVWRTVVKDLVDQLSEQIGVASLNIYVEPLPQNNAFNTSYDHILREALAERGYALVTSAHGTVMHLWYESYIPKYVDENGRAVYSGDDVEMSERDKAEHHKEFVLILTAVSNTVPVAKAAGIYKLPPYGFSEADGINARRYETAVTETP